MKKQKRHKKSSIVQMFAILTKVSIETKMLTSQVYNIKEDQTTLDFAQFTETDIISHYKKIKTKALLWTRWSSVVCYKRLFKW